jgi:hypothetical protein
MTREQFLERFYRLSETDQPGITTLANQVMDDARQAVRAAVEVWSGGKPDQERKAAAILSALDELAFVPLLEKGEPPDPERRVWFLRSVGSTYLEPRAKIVAAINKMLDDRRKPSSRPMAGPPLEENPGIPRVCDEAYLAHRQLLNFAESREQYFQNAHAFLSLSEDQKDAEIQNLKKSNTWKRLTGAPAPAQSPR